MLVTVKEYYYSYSPISLVIGFYPYLVKYWCHLFFFQSHQSKTLSVGLSSQCFLPLLLPSPVSPPVSHTVLSYLKFVLKWTACHTYCQQSGGLAVTKENLCSCVIPPLHVLPSKVWKGERKEGVSSFHSVTDRSWFILPVSPFRQRKQVFLPCLKTLFSLSEWPHLVWRNVRMAEWHAPQ